MTITTKVTDDSKEWPLVTIGIPTYNGGHGLVKAFHSVVEQGYPNVEILISNNGSSDETVTVCQELVRLYPQLRYFHHVKNIGMFANFEFLLRHARGKYFMWVADDDTLAEGALPVYVDYMEDNPRYSVVSGKIEYWLNGAVSAVEEGFNFSHKSPLLRVIAYYFKVIYGGMFHGLMRRELAQKIKLRKVIGNDWHFVANLAFLGKMKNLDFIGYRKRFGGTSRSFQNYAKLIGESPFAGKYPYIKISIDTYKDILSVSPVYSSNPWYKRFFLALGASFAVLISYYVTSFPFVIGGKIKRSLKRILSAKKGRYAGRKFGKKIPI